MRKEGLLLDKKTLTFCFCKVNLGEIINYRWSLSLCFLKVRLKKGGKKKRKKKRPNKHCVTYSITFLSSALVNYKTFSHLSTQL